MPNEVGTMRLSKREFLRRCSLGLGFCLANPLRLEEILRWETIFVGAHHLDDEPGRFAKEAWFCVKTEGGVQCLKCPHSCLISTGESGKCRNRTNIGGTLYEIGYGNPCAAHIDPIEKKPLFHFLPGTEAYSVAVAGCNLRCLNCQNWQISQVSPRETDNVDLMPARLVEEAVRNRSASIAFTYSEPNTFYQYGYDTSIETNRGPRFWRASVTASADTAAGFERFITSG